MNAITMYLLAEGGIPDTILSMFWWGNPGNNVRLSRHPHCYNACSNRSARQQQQRAFVLAQTSLTCQQSVQATRHSTVLAKPPPICVHAFTLALVRRLLDVNTHSQHCTAQTQALKHTRICACAHARVYMTALFVNVSDGHTRLCVHARALVCTEWNVFPPPPPPHTHTHTPLRVHLANAHDTHARGTCRYKTCCGPRVTSGG
jgi:hypothetical protein